MCEHKHDRKRPKWKAFKGFNSKIQAKAIGGGEGAKEEIEKLIEPSKRRI